VTGHLSDERIEQLLAPPIERPPDPAETVRRILARRRQFGITRLGSITELDRIGIPVAQAVRPSSLSVSVNQGKGLDASQAAISALMESLEGWASERISADRIRWASLRTMNGNGLWSHLADGPVSDEEISWIEGWDLLTSSAVSVPLALVDTAYTIPSPHPGWLPRNTTGLAASTGLHRAIEHACYEALERHVHREALGMPHFFDRFKVDSRSVLSGSAGEIMRRLSSAGCSIGIWSFSSEHGPPFYWCHVMESEAHPPLAPWPAEGFGCDRTHDRALSKALLEACQSRLGIISAGREDMGGQLYEYQDHKQLREWRRQLTASGAAYLGDNEPAEAASRWPLEALRRAGAAAVIVVELFSDEAIPLHVVRVVTPPLKTAPGPGHGI
jgi:ribosomal protein S12 methylthiotransferase accessory factor